MDQNSFTWLSLTFITGDAQLMGACHIWFKKLAAFLVSRVQRVLYSTPLFEIHGMALSWVCSFLSIIPDAPQAAWNGQTALAVIDSWITAPTGSWARALRKNRSRDDATSTNDEVAFDSYAHELRSFLQYKISHSFEVWS